MARSVGSDDGGSGAPARRRKPRHFGTVRRLPSGRYQASYLRDGVRHTAPTTFATKTDADLFLDDVSTDLRRGSWTDPRAAAVPLSDYANSWLAGRNDLRPTTRAKYRYLLAKHIVPQLGDRRLAQLTPSGVRAWYQALSEHAQSTADDAYRLLRAICSTAVADGHLSINPCKVKGGGAIRPSARPVASIDELRRAVERRLPTDTGRLCCWRLGASYDEGSCSVSAGATSISLVECCESNGLASSRPMGSI